MSDELINFGCFLGVQGLTDVDTIFSIIGTIILVGIAVLNFLMKLKKYKADGKIDEEEKKDLMSDIQEIAEEIKSKAQENKK